MMKDYDEMARSVLARRDRYAAQRKKERRRWAAAGCLCLAAMLGIGSWRMSAAASQDGGAGGTYAEAEIEHYDGAKEGVQAAVMPEDAEMGELNADAPVQGGSTGELQAEGFDAVWGGSYLDESGRWVVWLTEDTAENRQEVFQRDPDLSESGTTFRAADYSLAYLTALLADISEGMRDGQLPFVTSAGVMESRNRVEVTLTTRDDEAMELVQAYDPTGGAIEFRCVAGSGQEALAVLE